MVQKAGFLGLGRRLRSLCQTHNEEEHLGDANLGVHVHLHQPLTAENTRLGPIKNQLCQYFGNLPTTW
eukprot:4498106-Amphidinium_carterae.2